MYVHIVSCYTMIRFIKEVLDSIRVHRKEQGGRLTASRKSFSRHGQRGTGYSHHLALRTLEFVAQSTSQQTNKSQSNHAQITADARNGPCCYMNAFLAPP
jgi:hypothetical protein